MPRREGIMQGSLFEDDDTATQVAPEGFVYVADFLAPDEQASLLREIRALPFEHDTFRGQRLKRAYAQFGYSYVSSGRKLNTAAPVPAFLRAVIEKAAPHCPGADEFNQCIVTHYPPDSGIGWHTDAPGFGGCIVGVSLGGNGLFQFRPNGAQVVCYEVRVVPGSLYVLRGPSRWKFQHQVVPVTTDRFSLTFRHVSGKKDRSASEG
jgi:alkylated DNA repair dioxygenase AlkB